MRAIVIHAAKDLRVEQREDEPVGPGEVAVRIEAGGICGSDLHYYNHGGFGAIRLREPMILGHEIAGVVAELGSGVAGLSVGDRVAVNPSRPCHRCRFCLRGLPNHCLHMRFYGSAMPMPHIQGGFREPPGVRRRPVRGRDAGVDVRTGAGRAPGGGAPRRVSRRGAAGPARPGDGPAGRSARWSPWRPATPAPPRSS